MHTTDLIAMHVQTTSFDGIETIDGICCVTGANAKCIPKKQLLTDSFTDWSLLAAPDSELVGVNVVIAWTHGTRAEGKKRDFCPERHACWVASDREFTQINRQRIRDMVLTGSHDTPWAGWVTTGYKKHGSIRTTVNHGRHGIWGFDDHRPDCRDIAMVNDWWDRLRKYQDAGIGRMNMESLDAPPGVMKSIPVSLWMDFTRWANDKYLSALYRFLCYLLPSKDELKAMDREIAISDAVDTEKGLAKKPVKRRAQIGLF